MEGKVIVMLKISEFSIMTRITVKMLRNYDEMDLIKPAYIDEQNGYRYYEEAQLIVANRILSLKNMGFHLSMIKKILNEYKDETSLHTYLRMQIHQLDEEIETLTQRKRMIENALLLEEQENLRLLDVVLKEIPAHTALCYHTNIQSYEEEKFLWLYMHEHMDTHHVTSLTPSNDTSIYYRTREENDEIDIEIQRNVPSSSHVEKPFFLREVLAKMVASYTYKGCYKDICDGILLVNRWIVKNGYVPCGPLSHIYHVSPKTKQDESHQITEIYIPIRPAE